MANYTAKDVEGAFAAARQKIAHLLAREESAPRGNGDFRAVYFHVSNFEDYYALRNQNNFGDNLQGKGWGVASAANTADDVHAAFSFPPDFFKDPNKAMQDFYKAAKDSGLAVSGEAEDMNLSPQQAGAIKWGVAHAGFRPVGNYYQGRHLISEMGPAGKNIDIEVAAAAAEARASSYARMTTNEYVAFGETKLALDKFAGQPGHASVDYTGSLSVSYHFQTGKEMSDFQNTLTEKLPKDQKKSPLAITTETPEELQLDHIVHLKINPEREAEFYKDPNKFLSELQRGQKGEPIKLSADSVATYTGIGDKVQAAKLASDLQQALYNGAHKDLIERLKTQIGISEKTHFPERAYVTDTKDVYDLVREVSSASENGFSKEEKKTINAHIEEIAKHMKNKMVSEDNITPEQRSDAGEALQKLKTNLQSNPEKPEQPQSKSR